MSELLYPKIDPKEYLKLAEELSCKVETAATRTAADRAYYAAFLTSRDILTEKGYLVPSYWIDDHENVCNVLNSKDVLGNYGKQQIRLRLARNLVNYNNQDLYLGQPYDCKRLTWMLNTSKEIIRRVETLPDKLKKK